MRVRLRRALSGISGGISLSQFVPGIIYDVDPRTASQLISMGAEFVSSTTPALVVPLEDKPTLTDEQLTGGVTVIQPMDLAADQPPSRRRKS